MQSILKLENPILINGKNVSELTYDTNEITPLLFAEADAKRKLAAGAKNVAITPAAEFDYGLHLYLGFAAVIAVNGNIDFSDMERVRGADVVDIMAVGRNFILKSEEQPQANSDEQSEITQEPTTQA